MKMSLNLAGLSSLASLMILTMCEPTWAMKAPPPSRLVLPTDLPHNVFRKTIEFLEERDQVCLGATCKALRAAEDRVRANPRKNAIIVPPGKNYRNPQAFMTYLNRFARVPQPGIMQIDLGVFEGTQKKSLSVVAPTEKKPGKLRRFFSRFKKEQKTEPVSVKDEVSDADADFDAEADSDAEATIGDVLTRIKDLFPGLQELRLANDDLDESDLAIIGQMTNLRVLDLDGTPFHHPGIQHLRKLTKLRSLNISAPGQAPSNFSPTSQFMHLSDMRQLVYLDFTPTVENKRAFQGWILLNSAEDPKNGYASYRKGLMHEYGTDEKGPRVDFNLAYAAYEKAAHLGHPLALTKLGELGQKSGGGVEGDIQAYYWFGKAAELGHAEGLEGLWETKLSRFSLKELARRHADLIDQPQPTQGRPEDFAHQAEIAFMYQKGVGVARDLGQAVQWFQKASEQGLAEARFFLGQIYLLGKGVPQDYSRALELLQKGANQGLAQAQVLLGFMYLSGQGVVRNQAQAIEWFRKGADQGLATAQYNLGYVYLTARDPVRARRWYMKAAEQGFSEAQNLVGNEYYDAQNFVRAVEWYRTAAQQRHSQAECSLGFMYLRGIGVPQNDALAVQWFRKSAESGVGRAQDYLGILYYQGRGIEQNNEEAVRWFRQAADQGMESALFNLAYMYQHGHGVGQDRGEAIRLYGRAAAQGCEAAKAALRFLGVDEDGPQ